MSAALISPSSTFDYQNLDPDRKKQIIPAVKAIQEAAQLVSGPTKSKYKVSVEILACALVKHLEELKIPSTAILDDKIQTRMRINNGQSCLIGYFKEFDYLIDSKTEQQGQVNSDRQIIRGKLIDKDGNYLTGCFTYERKKGFVNFFRKNSSIPVEENLRSQNGLPRESDLPEGNDSSSIPTSTLERENLSPMELAKQEAFDFLSCLEKACKFANPYFQKNSEITKTGEKITKSLNKNRTLVEELCKKNPCDFNDQIFEKIKIEFKTCIRTLQLFLHPDKYVVLGYNLAEKQAADNFYKELDKLKYSLNSWPKQN